MIGLKRNTVKLFPHDKRWKLLFEKEKKLLEKKLGKLVIDIQHIGSTAALGIPAKPIIDIAVGVGSMKDAKTLIGQRRPLKDIGYLWNGHMSKRSIHLLFIKGSEEQRTHYLHVVKYKGSVWKRDLLFRDYLRTHRSHAKLYAELKKSLVKWCADDRKTYTKSKKKFIRETIKMAQF